MSLKPAIEKLLQERYYLSNETSWDQIAKRLSFFNKDVEEDIRQMFFLPSSPTIMNGNSGGERSGTLSSCFIIDIEDSMENIMDTMKNAAIITKKSGGVGINFSSLRGSSEMVKSNGKKSGGVLPFVAIYDAILDGVRQGGCLKSDSLITTEDGEVYLHELIKENNIGWHDHNLNVYTENGIKKSPRFFVNGKDNVKQIKLSNGHEIVATNNHKFKVLSKDGFCWKAVSDLEIGDFLLVDIQEKKFGNKVQLKEPDVSQYHFNCNVPTFPKYIDDDFAYLLGFMVGDGFCAQNDEDYRIGFTVSKDSATVKFVHDTIFRLFGINLSTQKEKSDKIVTLVFRNKLIKEFFRINGLLKGRSINASIPKIIRMSDSSTKGSFIGGLLEADGTVLHGFPKLYTSSYKLAKEVSIVLYNLGIPNLISEKKRCNGFSDNPYFSVKITSFLGLNGFKEKIKVLRGSRFENSLNWNPDLNRESSFTIPFASLFLERQANEYEKIRNNDHSKYYLRKRLLRYMRGDRNLTISGYKKISEDLSRLEIASEEINFYPVQINEINDHDDCETYDIEVNDVHHYLANGLICHNSRRGAGMTMLNCLSGSTLISTIGGRAKVEDLVGSRPFVYCVDEKGKARTQQADKVWKTGVRKTIKIEFDNNSELTCTPDHLVMLSDRTYRAAELLTPEDFVLSFHNKKGFNEFRNSRVVSVTQNENEEAVYDISVPEFHNFVANNIFVHNCNHPDIWQFIHAKEDTTKFTRSNFSVGITNEFVENLEKNPDAVFNVKEIVSGKDVPLLDDSGEQVTYKRLWDEIVKLAHKSAEPGLFNIDEARERCTCKHISGKVYSNPCLTGDTLIAVADGRGYVSIKQLADEKTDIPVYSFNRSGKIVVKTMINARKTGENKDIFEVEFDTGLKIKCTGNHKFLNISGHLVEANNLVVGDGIMGVVGDKLGFCKYNECDNFSAYYNSDVADRELMRNYQKNLDQNNCNYSFNYDVKDFDIKRRCECCGNEFVTNYEHRQATFCSYECMVKYTNKPFSIESCKVNDLLCHHKVMSIKYIGKEDVYDGTVEDTHTMIVGGKQFVNKNGRICEQLVITSQCSEFVHTPYNACCLGSINLHKLVENKGFNWNRFDSLVKQATIFLNNIIDNNDYPIQKIKEETLNSRPIGLGVMGLAHAFFEMGIPYGSAQAKDFTENLIRRLTLISMQKSIDLAKQNKKSFEYFDYDTFIDANKRFFKEPVDYVDIEQMKSDLKQYGCYNSSQTSIAPTGSISFVADTSGGIEPVFSLCYVRKIEKLNKQYEEVYVSDPVFDNYLEKNYKNDKDAILKYVSDHSGSCKGCDLLPENVQSVFCTAADLAPIEHLDILEATSKNTSLSVSKTLNVNNSATVEDVGQVYLDALKRGIIGVTVYRDGCREGILINKKSNTQNKNKIVKADAPKRPKELVAQVNQITISGQKYYAVIGLFENDVYEVFTGLNYNENGEIFIPKDVKDGRVVKEGRGKYILVHERLVDGKNVVCEYKLHNRHADENVEAITRLVSWGLRHGGNITFCVDQLEKVKGDMCSFAKALSRTLKKFISDGTVVSGSECEHCKNKLVRKEGCITCLSCGYSKCS